VADVTLRKPDTLEEVTVDQAAAPFFRNQGFVPVAEPAKPQSTTKSKE
jgi:hypothetical protein